MTILEDIAKIPRKHKNGLGSTKIVTSVNINPVTLEAAKATAKRHNVSISGLMELALDRLLADMDAI
jgi:predicted transcriptional regulator